MSEAPGPINFTMFLTLFGERLQGTDPEEVIRNAFGCFDEENAGEYRMFSEVQSISADIDIEGKPTLVLACYLSRLKIRTSVGFHLWV